MSCQARPLPPAASEAFARRAAGLDRSGEVDLRAFDEGMVLALGGNVIDKDGHVYSCGNPNAKGDYYIRLASVCPPPGLPGIPITFAYPVDIFAKYYIPAIIVRRDDIVADMFRWQPGATQYTAPGPGAIPVGENEQGTVFSSKESLPQAEPVDLLYTISILAKHRQGIGTRKEVNAVFKHVLRRFQAYGAIPVIDSVGDIRTYEAYREGITMLDDLSEIGARMVGFAVTVRVEGELDLADPTVIGAETGNAPVTSPPQVNFSVDVE